MEITLHIPEMGQLAEAIRFHADQAGARLYAQIAAEAPVTAAPAQAPTAAAQAPTVPAQPVVAPVAAAATPVPAVAPAPAPVAPTAAPVYTLADLQRAAAGLRDAGKLPQLQALLTEFGAASLLQLPSERYGEFAGRLRGLGAKL